MIDILTNWILGRWIKLAVSAAIAGTLVVSCMVRDASLVRKGMDKRDAQIIRGNNAAIKKGSDAAARSGVPGASGVRDPWYVE